MGLGLLARVLTPYAGVEPGAADVAVLASPPDWPTLAGLEAKSLAIKWGLLMLAAAALAAVRGYSLIRPMGPGRVRLPAPQLILFGLAVAIPLSLFALAPR